MIWLIFKLALAIGDADAGSNANSSQCFPQIFGSDNQVFMGRYPVADRAFDQRKYHLAFKSYYQYFFCLGGPSETVNPRAEDSGAAAFLRSALSLASTGRYQDAVVSARAAVKRDHQFGEANFILGDLLFVLGDKHAARIEWRNALANPGYPAPSDFTSAQTYAAAAAAAMLTRHK